MCSLPVACGVTHQMLESPKVGFPPKAELLFVVLIELPLTLN